MAFSQFPSPALAYSVCTSTTRPTSPTEGYMIYETDTNKALVYDGSSWEDIAVLGAWTTYTPTNPNITLGNGTCNARYKQMGKTVHFFWYLIAGTTTTLHASDNYCGLPVTARATYGQTAPLYMQDAGVRHWFGGAFILPNTTTALLVHAGTGGVVVAGSPFTVTTGDIFCVSGTYEAA